MPGRFIISLLILLFNEDSSCWSSQFENGTDLMCTKYTAIAQFLFQGKKIHVLIVLLFIMKFKLIVFKQKV
jgi:hypothetical protein